MNTFQRALASLIAGAAAIAASPAIAQVTVNTPAGDPTAPTDVQAGPVNVQSGPAGTTVNVPPGAVNSAAAVVERIGENAAARQNLRQERISERQTAREDWRMRNHNGSWWYWGPNNQWSVYQNNAWSPYASNGALTPPPAPAPNANATTAPPASVYQPAQAYRRGPLGIRRYSMGYRGMPAAQQPVVTQGTPTQGAPSPQTNAAPQAGANSAGPTTTTP